MTGFIIFGIGFVCGVLMTMVMSAIIIAAEDDDKWR